MLTILTKVPKIKYNFIQSTLDTIVKTKRSLPFLTGEITTNEIRRSAEDIIK